MAMWQKEPKQCANISYIICEGENIIKLETQVKTYIQEGYKPLGGIAVAGNPLVYEKDISPFNKDRNGIFCQAMMREGDET